MSYRGETPRHPVTKLTLTVGFLALGTAVFVAYSTPATGYEISIYAGTPLLFWVGFGVALVASVTVALTIETRVWRRLALLLGGAAMFVFTALPIVRNYHFYASADSMTHLGWVRDIASGVLEPVALFYPGLHMLAVLTQTLTGFDLPRSLMLVVSGFTLVFFLFVTLTVRELTDSGLGTAVGAVSAFMLLPINVIITKLSAHPISQTILYFSLVLFLFARYLSERPDTGRVSGHFVGTSLLLLVTLVALVLYHPLGAVVVLILLGTVSAVQFASRRLRSDTPISLSRPLYVPTVVLAVWVGIWIVFGHQALVDQAERIVFHISSFIEGSGGSAGEIVSDRQSSLQQVGAGLLETYLKLFFVNTVYAALTGVVILLALAGRLGEYRNASVPIKLTAFGLLVLFPWTVAQFVGNISSLFFRYVGFMMVVATILGAFTIHHAVRDRRPASSRTRASVRSPARIGLVVVLGVLLVVSAAFTFPSPSIYQPSGHMTAAQFDGYGTTFDHVDEEYQLVGIGMGVGRYRHAVEGTSQSEFGTDSGVVPSPEYDHDLEGFLRNESLGEGRYLILSEQERVSRISVYRGFRYDASDFQAVESGTGINHVFANGEVDLYLYTNPTDP